MSAPAVAPGDIDRPATLTARPANLAAAIARLHDLDAASVPVLAEDARRALIAEAAGLPFGSAKPVVGAGERAVYQDFELTLHLPPGGAFARTAAALERLVNRALRDLRQPPCPPVTFNDRVVQRYRPGCAGISPHRDHLRYVRLVAVLVIAGAGRFFICGDRSGRDAREVPAPPGSLLLMRAPGFAGSDHRPFHMLRDVTSERLILGLRQDARA